MLIAVITNSFTAQQNQNLLRPKMSENNFLWRPMLVLYAEEGREIECTPCKAAFQLILWGVGGGGDGALGTGDWGARIGPGLPFISPD